MGTHAMRENLWWTLAFLALAAALLLGSKGQVQKYFGDNGPRDSTPTEFWDMWPTRPLR